MSQKIIRFKKRSKKGSRRNSLGKPMLSHCQKEQHAQNTKLLNILYARDYDLSDYFLASLHERSQAQDCEKLIDFKVYESRVNERIQNNMQTIFSELTRKRINLKKCSRKMKAVQRPTKETQSILNEQNTDIKKQELEVELEFKAVTLKWPPAKQVSREEKDEITTETSARGHLKPATPQIMLPKLKKSTSIAFDLII